MVSIASQEILLTTSQQYCNVEFFRLLLSCATLKPRKIASLTFDLWLSLQVRILLDCSSLSALFLFLTYVLPVCIL
jgi:hypothetical protein